MTRRHPLANCEECEWNTEHTGFADAVGPQDAEIIFIGESPGKKEGKTGIPFTGTTGELLGSVLNGIGIKRNDVRLTNAVACHPPYALDLESTEPPQGVIEACRPRLMAELDSKAIAVLMGNTARRAVTGDKSTGILKARQAPPIFNEDGSVWLSTIHPAACLRNPDNFPSFIKDMKKLKALMSDDPEVNIYLGYEPPRVSWVNTSEDAIKVLKELWRKCDELVIDIETGVEKDRDFSHPNEWLSIGFGYADNKAVVLGTQSLQDDEVKKLIGELLSAKKIICHNGKYDLQVLMRLQVIRSESFRLFGDTMLASYVLDERPGHHGLKSLSSERLGAPDYEQEISRYVKGGKSYANIPRKLLYKYNGYDCAFTWNLWQIFKAEMDEKGRALHDRLCEAATELIYIEHEGVTIDEQHLERLTESYTEDLDVVNNALSEWVDNPRSVPQIKKALHKLGLPNDTTSAATLGRLRKTCDKNSDSLRFLNGLLEQRRLQKLYGTYVEGTRKRIIDHRVFPTYLLHGTTSGRLAARNPNIQNVPRDSKIKDLFIPGDGRVFIQCDFGQAELRTIAILAEDYYLKGVFEDSSRDIHGEVADTLFGHGKWNKEDRVRAKSYVFGSIYGLSPYSIALAYGITELRAFREQQAFFRMIPETMKWRNAVMAKVFKEREYLETVYGRKRRFMLLTQDNKNKLEKEILAFLPQSTASDVTLNSIIKLRRMFGSGKDAPKIRITVHDSIIVDCDESIKEDVAHVMSKTMIDTAADNLGDFVPFTVDAEFGYSWGQLA